MFKQLKTSTSAPSYSTSSDDGRQTITTSSSTSSIPKSASALYLLKEQRQTRQSRPPGYVQKASLYTSSHTSLREKSPRDLRTPEQSTPKASNTARKKVKAKAASGAPSAPSSPARTESRRASQNETPPDEEVQGTPTADQSIAEGEAEEEPNAKEISTTSLIPRIEENSDELSTPSAQRVVVCVRVRAMDKDANQKDIWKYEPEKNRITPTEAHPTLAKRNTGSSDVMTACSEDGGMYDFRYDALIAPSQGVDEMYADRIAPVVDGVVQGYNGTVFAYGQTGSGKTYTMSGNEAEQGVIPRAVHQVFERVEKSTSREYLLRVSYLEIYNESLHDLLEALPSSSGLDNDGRPSSPIKGGSSHMVVANGGNNTSSLRIFESAGRVQIHGLREEIVTTADQVLNLLSKGQTSRHQAATDWNERSSRSHCVFILTLESRAKAQSHEEGNPKEVQISQLNLIDLAGSERAASEKDRRKEGAFINKSLLTLGTVISKLSEQSQDNKKQDVQHIPYRDSKLTRLLQASLGGNARIAVVCTLSPYQEHAIESLSTLRFGQRCKMVVTHAKQGTIMDDKALIARYRQELDKLRIQLENAGTQSTMESSDSIKALQSERARAEQDVQDMNAQRAELKKQVEHLTRLILTGKNVANQGDHSDDTQNDSDIENEAKDPVAAKTRRMRAARRSDVGPPSPGKGRPLHMFASPRTPMTPLRNNSSENTASPSLKPFAMESELAQLRKSLSVAIQARQASEEARGKELQLWKAKVAELESVNKEQEEELDEAEEAFEKLRKDRDAQRVKANEEREANRLLKLIAQSRKAEHSEEHQKALALSETEIHRLTSELHKAHEERQKANATTAEQMALLEKQVASLKEQMQQETSDQPSHLQRIAELEQELAKAQSEGRKDDKMGGAENTMAMKGNEELLQEITKVRAQLDVALSEKERMEKELKQNTLEQGQEDAERDFADLVQGGQDDKQADVRAELKKLKGVLEEREREMEDLRLKSSKPLPVPTLSPSATSLPDDLRTSLESQIQKMEERNRNLEKQLHALQVSSSSLLPTPPLSSSGCVSPSIVELQIESDIQRSRIASLERQLTEARARIEDSASVSSLPGSPIRRNTHSTLSSRSNPGTPIRRGGALRLDNVVEEDSTAQDSPLGRMFGSGTKSLQRGGSLRDYKRFNASSYANRPNNTMDLASPIRSNPNVTALERELEEERAEVERLNTVISTQRSIMADLEASVAAWKKRLRTQHDIIAKLVESGAKATPSLLASSSPITGNESSSGASTQSDMKRTSSSASSPYYGAHIYNRPSRQTAGLGLGSSSPTKGVNWLATMPGMRPDPLPLPDGAMSPTRARRRKTIENEIESLKESPRVESTKSRLLEPSLRSRPLPVPGFGSPPKTRASKDYYI